MSKDPAKDVMDVLNADVGLSLTTGTDLFKGQIREVSTYVAKDSVFVRGDSGAAPIRSMGQVDEIRFGFVTILLRWRSFAAGDTKIRAITDVLQGVAISGYLDVVATTSEPTIAGNDAEGNHLWSMTYMLVYNELA